MKSLIEQMKNAELSPTELSEIHMKLAGEYAYKATELDALLIGKPEMWLALKENSKSDTEANRKWDMTPEGIKENSLKLQMKSIEKMMSALKSRMRIKELEATNII